MIMLKVTDLKVNYGGIEALKGISFDVRQGQIVTLIGANGAGKTSVLHTISGLIRAKSGKITFMIPADLPEGTVIRPELVMGKGFDYAWNVTAGDRQVRTATVSSGTEKLTENLQENLKITAKETEKLGGAFVVEVMAK